MSGVRKVPQFMIGAAALFASMLRRGAACDGVCEMSSTGVCVVIPVLNEGKSISGIIERIPAAAVIVIIVADSGSKDRTSETVAAKGRV
jgi:hypothetical protein